MSRLRLIVKVPDHVQTGPDTWQDTTKMRTFDIDCPDGLEKAISGSSGAVVIGAELLPDRKEPTDA